MITDSMATDLMRQTRMMSSPDMMRETAAYRAIADQGEGAVPRLLAMLRDGSAPAIAVMMLLHDITGYRPDVPAGDVAQMRQAWLDYAG